MLDLERLDRLVDEALEKETSESLKSWLMSKRTNNLPEYLKNGEYEVIFSENVEFCTTNKKTSKINNKSMSQETGLFTQISHAA